jgi:Fic family protein
MVGVFEFLKTKNRIFRKMEVEYSRLFGLALRRQKVDRIKELRDTLGIEGQKYTVEDTEYTLNSEMERLQGIKRKREEQHRVEEMKKYIKIWTPVE